MDDKLDEALKKWDFYQIAKITNKERAQNEQN